MGPRARSRLSRRHDSSRPASRRDPHRGGSRGSQSRCCRLAPAIGGPTAVIAGSDLLAAACYAAATQTGIRIGPDLAVTGFDGSAISRILAPALTTVAIPLADIATRLTNRVIHQVAGTPHNGGEVLDAALIWGESA